MGVIPSHQIFGKKWKPWQNIEYIENREPPNSDTRLGSAAMQETHDICHIYLCLASLVSDSGEVYDKHR